MYMMLGGSQGLSASVQKISSHQDSIPVQSSPQGVKLIITVLVLKHKRLRRPEHISHFREKSIHIVSKYVEEGSLS